MTNPIYAYRVIGQRVEISEVRPDWQDRTKKMEKRVVKTIYVRSQNRWKVFGTPMANDLN